jgi:hypothetical protein
MEQSQQGERHEADKDFLESLEQLEDILQEENPPTEGNPDEQGKKPQTQPLSQPQAQSVSPSKPKEAESKLEIDLDAWEDAIADIEQYLANNSRNKSQ